MSEERAAAPPEPVTPGGQPPVDRKRAEIVLKLLAAEQLVGGGFGLAVTLMYLQQAQGLAAVVVGGFAFLNLVTVGAGAAIMFSTASWRLLPSMLIQVVQIPVFAGGGAAFHFFSGLCLTVGIGLQPEVQLQAWTYAGSNWSFELGQKADELRFAVDVVALGTLIVLRRLHAAGM